MVWAGSAVASAAEAVGVAVLSVCAVAAVGTVWFAVRHRVPAPAVVRATVHTPARRALPAPRRAISGPRATVTVTENIYERVAR
jgi:ABC-type sulfate transport system permease component